MPVVLSRQEVQQILICVRQPIYRLCLTTIYLCGLPLNEGRCLQVADVDGARGLLHIHGKGSKERYVPLPDPTLAQLPQLWRTHRCPVWLFPALSRHRLQHRLPQDCGPIPPSTRWPRLSTI